MYRFSALAVIFTLCVAAVAQTLSSNVATVQLVARLMPKAEIASLAVPSGVAVQQSSPETLVIDAPAGAVTTIPFRFTMNSRAARIRAKADPGVTIDVAPSASSCEWIHTGASVTDSRVVAALSRCTPSDANSGVITIMERTATTRLTMVIEPVAD